MEQDASQKVAFLWRIFSMRHRNGSLNFLCRGPPIFLWRMGPDAPQKHIFLWRILLHAPQKRWGRLQPSRWLWGPLFFCDAWALVRHRITYFSGASLKYAPQKGEDFCGAPPTVRHRIYSVAHGHFSAPQNSYPPIASRGGRSVFSVSSVRSFRFLTISVIQK